VRWPLSAFPQGVLPVVLPLLALVAG